MIFENFITFLSKVLFFSGLVNDKNSFPKPLSKQDELAYFQKFWQGDMQAKDILIRHNLRLVAHVVKKYNGAAEADDLISCGTIGLIKAINSFKADKGTQISTYASRCIENEVLMFLRVSKKHQQVGSLNESLGDDHDGNEISLVDIITEDREQPAVDEAMQKHLMRKLVAALRERLNEREFKIIALRYGLNDHVALPQREVAKHLNISRSYISRIEKHALELAQEVVRQPAFRDFR
ncbi:MAG: RNA polymerase sporulation sigma factor SigK [Clostridia bacterium]|nr:RNA polymerase sporulation sigma factor SigK [Clostridia bacterium]